MKIVHWTMHNGSGMNAVAQSLVLAEQKAGLNSILGNPHIHDEKWDSYLDADIHIDHTHVPEFIRRNAKPHKIVYVAHGTPEHVFQGSVEAAAITRHGMSDSWMLMQYGLQHSDASVTFWPRHHAIMQSLCDKRQRDYVFCIPLGVDKSFWKPTPSAGHFAGQPALMTAENSHYIKWPLDLLIAWPWAYPKVKGSPSLHVFYLPTDQHRWFFPLANRNGAAYGTHFVQGALRPDGLVNAFNSVEYYIGLVRYGDFNRISLEANSSGCKTISYAGNIYSDFWLPEGDQRVIAEQLVKILNGEVEPRKKEPVVDVSITAEAMKQVYEKIL